MWQKSKHNNFIDTVDEFIKCKKQEFLQKTYRVISMMN
jgi:hypothetical protein